MGGDGGPQLTMAEAMAIGQVVAEVGWAWCVQWR